MAFFPEKRFELHEASPVDPSHNLVTAEARVSADEDVQMRFIDNFSLQLLLNAFYSNFIQRPLRGLGNFFIVTKSIFYDPSTRIDEKYLIS